MSRRSLHLTSPLMNGSDVVELQTLLERNGYLHAEIDGAYGPLTAQAVFRAKFWFGYRKPDQVAGALIVDYLSGGRQPNAAMRARARARKRARQNPTQRELALKWLQGRIGNTESPPNSNRVPWASVWYGIIGPWCAMAATRAYVEAGSKAFARGRRYAFVPFIVADAVHGRNGLALTHNPLPGDLVCYDWNGDGVADHVGLFERWIVAPDRFTAIEGNTAIGNDSNGGEVMRRNRHRSQVQAFVHVAR